MPEPSAFEHFPEASGTNAAPADFTGHWQDERSTLSRFDNPSKGGWPWPIFDMGKGTSNYTVTCQAIPSRPYRRMVPMLHAGLPAGTEPTAMN